MPVQVTSVQWHGKRASAIKDQALQAALPAAGQRVLDATDPLVPDDTGALQASGYVEVDDLDMEVGYDTDYAPFVHEDLTAFHDDGRAKFLEVGFVAAGDDALEVIAAAMRRRLGGP